jgi:hypothetical protein
VWGAQKNSGGALTNAAPNGTLVSFANDRMDVWVGRTKVFDDVAATNAAGRITDLKWVWNHGSGMTHFDHFAVRTLDEATALSQASTPDPSAAVQAAASSAQDGDIAPDRPTPNPFTRTMRFAYAVPSGSAPVDIGVFDIAGRRLRLLAHGDQAAGQYEVRWDGLADDGQRVKQGVYFLRASVGANHHVSRVV